jgi:two-component system OmpR family response regulator
MRVLVVEDGVRMAQLLKRALEEEGHAVDVCGDGPEGLWMATENPYAAIVLDVMLPGFDGFELCRRLRECGVWVPVLMLTARDQVGDRIRGLDSGADDYLVKPFSMLELAARLRALNRRDDRPRPAVLSSEPTPRSSSLPRSSRSSSSSCVTPTRC